MITDRLPNLTGKNLGLLKVVQDSFCEMWPNWEMLSSLYNSSGGALQNCFKYEPCDRHSYETCEFHTNIQFITLLQCLDAEHI